MEPAGETFGRLADVLERLWNDRDREPRTSKEPYRAPQFDGQGDVEFFIQQFQEVAAANEWGARATVLHLRRALQEGATDCGKPSTEEGIYNALRNRYGLSPREARARLSTLKKEYRTSLQEHAMEVERLVTLAYGDLPEVYRNGLALETFSNTLGNAYLQRHLLAVQAGTLGEAVRAGNEFLQVRTNADPGRSSIRAVDGEDDEEPAAGTTKDTLSLLLQSMQQLTEAVGKLQAGTKARPRPGPKEEPQKNSCWGCGKDGHRRQECPTRPWRKPASGNGTGPQQ